MKFESVILVVLASATLLLSSSSSMALDYDNVPFDPKHPSYFLSNLVSKVFTTNNTEILQWSVRGNFFRQDGLLVNLCRTNFEKNARFYFLNRTDLVSVKETLPNLYRIRFPLGMDPYRVKGEAWAYIVNRIDSRKTRKGSGPINIVAQNSSIFDVDITYEPTTRRGRINSFKFLSLEFGKWASPKYDVIFPQTNCPFHRLDDDGICKEIQRLVAQHLQEPNNPPEAYLIDQLVTLLNIYLKK